MEIIATVVAMLGLIIYAIVVAPHCKSTNLFTEPAFTNGWAGIAGAMTFSMWFYFAIDGAAMQVEEMKNPKKDIQKGYIPAFITLLVCALIAILLPVGIADYREVSQLDFPLAESIEMALDVDSIWPKAIAVAALFSMVASFLAIVLAFSRQTFAMGKIG